MTGTVYTCLYTNQSRSYLKHLVCMETLFLTRGAKDKSRQMICKFRNILRKNQTRRA